MLCNYFLFFNTSDLRIILRCIPFLIARINCETILLNNKVMIWGGKRSYAIYMLHMFVVMRLINQGIF